VNASLAAHQPGDRGVEDETHAPRLQQTLQFLAHLEAVRRAFARRVNGACKARCVATQGGFDSHRFRGRQGVLHGAQGALQIHLPASSGKAGFIRMQHEFSGGGKVAVDVFLGEQSLEASPAFRRQGQQRGRGVDGHAGAARGEKLQAPGPLLWVHLWPQLQGGVAGQQELGQLAPDARVGQGLHVGVAQLCAVGRARTGAGLRAVDHRHGMAISQQLPGGGQADDAGAEDADMQGGLRAVVHGEPL